MTSTIVTDDGVHLNLDICGHADAQPLLLSNSLGTSLEMWDKQITAFQSRFRVIRYDTRGHGRSDVPAGEYTMDRLGRDALCILDVLKIEQAHFCGLSLGGMTGMWLASTAPGRVNKLVLVNTAAELGPRANWQSRIDTIQKNGMQAIVQAIIERWFTPHFISTARQEVDGIDQMLLTTSPQGYTGCAAAVRDMDLRNNVPLITAKTLVISGTQDPATPPDKAREIMRLLPHGQLVTLDAAHLSNVERPEQFTQAVMNFLE